MLQRDNHVFMGMLLDLSPTKHKPEFMYEAHNIRITSSDREDTYLSLTNEKGTSKVSLSQNIAGYYLGHCAVQLYNEETHKEDDVLILFCKNPNTLFHEDEDAIYKINLSAATTLKPVTKLYHGNLGFSIEHPIEAFFISEATDINKVYWNDGYNQPRVINLNDIKESSGFDTQFDFVPTLDLNEDVTITRYSLGGMFAPGVIQYALSYYNKWGQQSHIFYTSQLLYIMFDNRGGNPDEIVPNSFKITIDNWQEGFDYIRIYSIHRTSLDAVPQCKIVQDIDLRQLQSGSTIEFVDNGQIGGFTDPSQFPYIGGENIVAQTWALKDNTLFLGNITLNKRNITTLTITEDNEDINIVDYIHDNRASILSTFGKVTNGMVPGFKSGELYRVGFQAQYKDGSWSEPIWIGDYTLPSNYRPNIADNKIHQPIIRCKLPSEVLQVLLDNDYKKVRGLCVFPKTTERNIIALGIVSPTLVTQIMSRNNVKNISSWFFRPLVPTDDVDWCPVYTHGFPVKDEFSLPDVELDYYIDQSIITLYSPDIEFNDDLQYVDKENLILNIFGIVDFDNIQLARSLYASSVAKLETGGEIKDINTDIVLAIPQWHDGIIAINSLREENEVEEHKLIPYIDTTNPIEIDYLVYPWQASGPLNNDIDTGLIPPTSVLKSKCLSLLLDSSRPFKNITLQNANISVLGLKVANNPEEMLNIVDNNDGTTFKYQENVDTELMGIPHKAFAYNYKLYLSDESPEFLKKYLLSEDPNVLDYANYRSHDFDLTTVDGKNAFISLKYKSPKHLLLNLGDTLLPNIENFGDNREDVFIFNDLIISDVFYFKVPPRAEVDGKLVIFAAYDSESMTDFQLLFPAILTWTGYSPTIYSQELLTQLQKYEGEPFLMVLDLSNYTFNGLQGKKYLTSVRGFQASNDIQTFQVAQVEIFSVISTIIGQDVQYIKIPYTLEGLKHVSYFQAGMYPGDLSMFVVENQSNQDLVAFNGFKILYDNKLSNVSFHNITDVVYRPPYTQVGLLDIPLFSFPYKTTTEGTVYGEIESYFLRNLVNPDLQLEIIPNQEQQDHTYPYSDYPKLFICDVYRNSSTIHNKFGGTTQEALKSNLWIPASNSYKIDTLLNPVLPTDVYIELNQGDTWFQKYYCLKTFPYATTDENQIINKAGFYCETRHNLNGIYDKDKPSTQLFINKDSFNKWNPVYNQSDNFFNYRILDTDFYKRNNFPYTFFWTNEKVNSADIDAYTNLTLVSSLDVNSVGGEITDIMTHNGSIYCFQPDGISKILFNSRVQIPVSDGVPIEIANSAKLEGVSNITNTIGCSNKWSVVSTNIGLFFIDDRRKSMFNIGEEGIPISVSSKLNMSNWFAKHSFIPWKRASNGSWQGVKICDDFVDNDVYIIGNNSTLGDSALVYSKRLDLFTSFMSYNEVDSIFNTGDSLYAFRTNISAIPKVELFKMHGGDYNYFFDRYEPFDFTFISTGDPLNSGPLIDKTFTGVELRALFTNDKYFDYIQAKNDYQDTGICNINKNALASGRHFERGDTAKKFRIWRTDIPRTIVNSKRTLDRVRNIWTKIKLGVKQENAATFGNSKMELHDINVLYHI